MKVYSMKYSDLEYWVKNKAEPGDLATYYVNNGEFGEFMYTYYYTKPDDNPRWRTWSDMKKLQKYLDNLGVTKMNKTCDNCKYFKNVPGSFSWCSHKDHAGALVPAFTSCADHELKQKSEAPFDNLKFFIKDQKTGELEVKYVCEDCGKVMEAPFHWQFRVPLNDKSQAKRPGYWYWCEDCWEKEKKK